MRLFLIAGTAMLLAACGEKDAAEQSANVSADPAAASFGGSDTTAIDAATASDANMAADVEYNEAELDALMNQDDDEEAAANRN